MKNNILLIIILIIGVGAVGFFAGMKYQQKNLPKRADFQSRQSGMPGGQQREGSGMVRGEIISRDGESVTVKLPDESSKIILISENTEINKTTEGSADDLETGKQVMVLGQTNPDGSVSAASIQLGGNLIRKDQL